MNCKVSKRGLMEMVDVIFINKVDEEKSTKRLRMHQLRTAVTPCSLVPEKKKIGRFPFC